MKIREIIVEGPKWDRFARGVQRAVGKTPSLSKENPNDEIYAAWDGFQEYYQSLVDAGKVPKINFTKSNGGPEYIAALYSYLMRGKSPADQAKFPKPTANDVGSKSYTQAYIKKMQAIARADRLVAQPAPEAPAAAPAPPGPPQQSGVQVKPGHRIVVISPANNGKYYKTVDGWTNVNGIKIQKLNHIQYLERVADSGGGREEKLPPDTTMDPTET